MNHRKSVEIPRLLQMKAKHYAEGSPEPTLEPGKIYLYSMRFCPFAHRAHLALNAKKVQYEPIFINLASKPKWFSEKCSTGKVPTLLYKNESLCESLLVADFIDEEFPGNSIQPSEPLKKIKDKILIEKFSPIAGVFYKLAMVHFDQETFNNLLNGIEEFEKVLSARKTNYFGGDEPLFLDYMIWPWFERFDSLAILYGNEAKIPYEKYPNLAKWKALMESNEAVKKHFASPEIHAKHFTLRKLNDNAAFDLIV